MGYSVLNRFAGAIIGSYLGENLLQSKDPSSPIQYRSENWTKIGIDNSQTGEIYAPQQKNATIEQIAVASLPEFLLFYESQDLLREALNKMRILTAANREVLLIWGSAISLASQEKQTENIGFIARILEKLTHISPEATEILSQIQKWLDADENLHSVVENLERSQISEYKGIALALYCFASTPEDFQICLKRAFAANYKLPTTAALTGAIAGAYNSRSGIAISWRYSDRDRATIADIYQFAKKLFYLWSGVYQPGSNNLIWNDSQTNVSVTAASNLQTRSFFKVISQK